MRKTTWTTIPFVTLILLSAACDDDDDELVVADAGAGTIMQVAAAIPDLSSMVAALQRTELGNTLSGSEPFTVFAPTNAAFDALHVQTNTTPDSLTAEALTPILNYHVVSGTLTGAELAQKYVATTLTGSDFRIAANAGVVRLTAANATPITVITTDIAASNGIIHIIDAVMLPPVTIAGVATETANLNMLVQALQLTDLINALAVDDEGFFTVFGPTDAAFAALLATNPSWNTLEDIPLETLTDMMRYHIVPGKFYSENLVQLLTIDSVDSDEISIDASTGILRLNQSASVITANVLASNGVIQIIDAVLIPPPD